MKSHLILLGILAALCTAQAADTSISLAGNWSCQLDRSDSGITEKWFTRSLTNQIHLPGSLPGQGFGDPPSTDTQWTGGVKDPGWYKQPELAKYGVPGNFKFPFWLTPNTYYAGPAWFKRNIEIPKSWGGKRIVLSLERPHWETRVWVDGQPCGMRNSLATPHEYELVDLKPGAHTIAIRVDNRTRDLDVGTDSHSVSDHTQGNWNGIVGKIELRATPLVYLDDLRVYPSAANKSIRVKGNIVTGPSLASRGTSDLLLTVSDKGGKILVATNASATWNTNGGQIDLSAALGQSAQTWDEFNPNIYRLKVTLFGHQYDTSFGLRDLSTNTTQFTINGNKIFIRGTLECCIFPKTGHPPTDLDSWRRIIRVCKSYGLNLIRFHSWCPPEAAFVAADEMGFYYQVECSSWANGSTTIGDGKPIDTWIYDEAERILKNYGNHPSFMLMPYGNEPGGPNHAQFLAKWVLHFKEEDPRRFYTSGSGWPQLPENQFHVTPDPRVQAWGGGLNSRINAKPPETTADYRGYIAAHPTPVISHEIGQWCVYPNFEEIPKYTGYLKAKNFEIFRDLLQSAGMGDLAKPFLIASGKLQTLCYKEDIESALRTPGMAGFELLDLHDFPGQGTALVGVVDPFWEDKGYVTGKEYSRFCNSTVPLARLPKRVFTNDESLTAQIEIAHFGPKALPSAVIKWRLVNESGKVLSSGQFPARTIPLGNANSIGDITADLKNVPAPAQCKLVVGIEGTAFENDWAIWVYPSQPANVASDVLITSQFDDAAQAKLKSGGNVLLTLPTAKVRNFDSHPVKLGFSSIFWNTAWTDRQPPTTLGILCDPEHPALAKFPTEFHTDWQWWYLIHRAGALRLDLLPKETQPIVRIIDDWFTARPLGLIVEGKIGAGKLIICGFDLTQNATDPVSRQLQSSLLSYIDSAKCHPSVEFAIDQVKSLSVEPANTFVRNVTASSEQEGYEALRSVDGDPETFWHTAWQGSPTPFPHSLTVECDAPRTFSGFTALPRQDGNHNGWIADFEIYASNDGQNWGAPVMKGTFSNDPTLKQVKFPAPITAKYIKLVALSGYANGLWAALAEFVLKPSAK